MTDPKFDRLQEAWDNMTPEDDPHEDMTDDEIEYSEECEAEARYEDRNEVWYD
jgi:hypothetical protein